MGRRRALVTRRDEMWAAIRRHMPRGRWVHVEDIRDLVEKAVPPTRERREPTTPYKNQPKWQRDLHGLLHYRKGKGEILWREPKHFMLPAVRGKNKRSARASESPGQKPDTQAELGAVLESQTEEDARARLREIAGKRRQSLRQTAAELVGLLAGTPASPRRRVSRTVSVHQGTPGLARLLKEVYEGRCQICRSSFLKRDGSPYSETHHIDPHGPDAPGNLLVLCATCHRKMHHAHVIGGGRMLARNTVTINRKVHRVTVHHFHRRRR